MNSRRSPSKARGQGADNPPAACGAEFAPFSEPAKVAALAELQRYTAPLRKLAPDMGAYMNEVSARRARVSPTADGPSREILTGAQADPHEPDWQHQFWGSNYNRLVDIKRRVDPDDVLWCNPCVGNERWHEVGNQLCRV